MQICALMPASSRDTPPLPRDFRGRRDHAVPPFFLRHTSNLVHAPRSLNAPLSANLELRKIEFPVCSENFSNDEWREHIDPRMRSSHPDARKCQHWEVPGQSRS